MPRGARRTYVPSFTPSRAVAAAGDGREPYLAFRRFGEPQPPVPRHQIARVHRSGRPEIRCEEPTARSSPPLPHRPPPAPRHRCRIAHRPLLAHHRLAHRTLPRPPPPPHHRRRRRRLLPVACPSPPHRRAQPRSPLDHTQRTVKPPLHRLTPPLHRRYTTATPPLHRRTTAAPPPLHCRYTAVTPPPRSSRPPAGRGGLPRGP